MEDNEEVVSPGVTFYITTDQDDVSSNGSTSTSGLDTGNTSLSSETDESLSIPHGDERGTPPRSDIGGVRALCRTTCHNNIEDTIHSPRTASLEEMYVIDRGGTAEVSEVKTKDNDRCDQTAERDRCYDGGYKPGSVLTWGSINTPRARRMHTLHTRQYSLQNEGCHNIAATRGRLTESSSYGTVHDATHTHYEPQHGLSSAITQRDLPGDSPRDRSDDACAKSANHNTQRESHTAFQTSHAVDLIDDEQCDALYTVGGANKETTHCCNGVMTGAVDQTPTLSTTGKTDCDCDTPVVYMRRSKTHLKVHGNIACMQTTDV